MNDATRDALMLAQAQLMNYKRANLLEVERRAFEAWYARQSEETTEPDRSPSGEYRHPAINEAWRIWLARASFEVHRGEYICPKCGLRRMAGVPENHCF